MKKLVTKQSQVIQQLIIIELLYSGVAEVCGALSEVGGLGPLAPMSSQVIFWLGAPSGPLMSGGP